MIELIDKNIFEHNAQCILHSCNCFCTMGGGIARIISKLYPEAVVADNATKSGDFTKLGTFTTATCKDGKIIYNVYGQYSMSAKVRQTNYEALYNGLSAAHADIRNKNLKTASLPFNIGCGLGGGSWRVVNSMIEDIWANSPVQLTICRYTP